MKLAVVLLALTLASAFAAESKIQFFKLINVHYSTCVLPNVYVIQLLVVYCFSFLCCLIAPLSCLDVRN